MGNTQRVDKQIQSRTEDQLTTAQNQTTKGATERQGKAKRQSKHRGSGSAEKRERAAQEGQNRTQTQGHKHKGRRQEAGRQQRTEGDGTRGPDQVHTCLSERPQGGLEHQR